MALKKHSTVHDVQRLILLIERDLLAESRLKSQLLAAGATLRAHRQDLRRTKARVVRPPPRPRAPARRPKRRKA
jgi:hypothetical protein